MNSLSARLCLIATITIATTVRLPAPIQEIPETPTPASTTKVTPAPTASPKPTRSKSAEKMKARSNTATPTPTTHREAIPYAGTWIGIVNWGIQGNYEHTIVIDAAQKTVNVNNVAGGTFTASVGPEGISWITGIFGEHKWTLKPNPDGRSALVTINGHNSSVFRRAN